MAELSLGEMDLEESRTKYDKKLRDLERKIDPSRFSVDEVDRAKNIVYGLENSGSDDVDQRVIEYYRERYRISEQYLRWVRRDFWGKVKCFHGTTSDRLNQILESGLIPDQETNSHSQIFQSRRQGFVFVYVEDASHALGIANYQCADRDGSSPVILEMKMDPKILIPDLDSHITAFKYHPTGKVKIDNIYR